jgi:hypothetical protein
LLRNELFVGTLAFCRRDSDEVDDEKEDDGVARRLRGREFVLGASFTFSFTLNIFLLTQQALSFLPFEVRHFSQLKI